MTVEELIEKLKEFPLTAKVGILDHGEVLELDSVNVFEDSYICDDKYYREDYEHSPLLFSDCLD